MGTYSPRLWASPRCNTRVPRQPRPEPARAAVEVRNAGRGSTLIVSVGLPFDDGITERQYLCLPSCHSELDGE